MTTRRYTDQYFANQTDKAKIKLALTKAIPANVTYFNLILALSELIQEFSSLAFADEVMHYPEDKAQ